MTGLWASFKGKAFNLTLVPIVILGVLGWVLQSGLLRFDYPMLPALDYLTFWFFLPVGGLVWLGGAVLAATGLAVAGRSHAAAEITMGAFLGLIVLAILTIPVFANMR